MEHKIQRAVVTGGAGFIGSHIVDALTDLGTEVLIIDDLSTGREEIFQACLGRKGARISIHRGDIGSSACADAVKAFRPDSVFHLAAQANVRKSVAAPDFDAATNVVGTVNMLEAAVQCGARKFLFSSTGGAIYGEQEYFPADENHPINPKCPYGVSKRAGELYLEYFAAHTPLQTVSLRFANVYGPRQNPKGEAGVVAVFIDRLLAGQKLTVNGNGTQTRDFVYVGDVVAAVLAAARSSLPEKFSIFNVGRGEETSVNQIVEALKVVWVEANAGAAPIESGFGPELPGEQQRSVITPAKIGSVLNWKPQVKLGAGLAQTVESFLLQQASG